MKRTLLATAAAIALVTGMNAASAQMGGQPGGSDQREPRMQNPPSGSSKGEEKVKPGVHEKEPGAAVQNQQGQSKEKMSQQGESKEKTTQQGTAKERMGQQGETKEKTTQQGQGQIQGQSKEQTQTKEKTGQGQTGTQQQQQGAQQQGSSSAKSVQLSSEQRTKIHASLSNHKVERVTNVNFTVKVGSRVPRTVHFYPLPVEIVEFVPEYQGYEYVLVGDEILIIDPDTLEIVAILPA